MPSLSLPFLCTLQIFQRGVSSSVQPKKKWRLQMWKTHPLLGWERLPNPKFHPALIKLQNMREENLIFNILNNHYPCCWPMLTGYEVKVTLDMEHTIFSHKAHTPFPPAKQAGGNWGVHMWEYRSPQVCKYGSGGPDTALTTSALGSMTINAATITPLPDFKI